MLTLGADPEMFVFDSSTGALIPAWEFLPGKQEEHVRWDAGTMYADGFAVEWTYGSPYTSLPKLVAATRDALQAVWDRARAHNPHAVLSLVNGVLLDQSVLDQTRDDYVELGCIPSFNAYGLTSLPVPNPRKLRYRFAGGHMHFGGLPPTANPNTLATALDLHIAYPYMCDDRNRATEHPLRRRYYGQAGEFRTPGEGRFEYRTLSNFWLKRPETMVGVWDSAIGVIGEYAVSRQKNLGVSGNHHAVVGIQSYMHQYRASEFDASDWGLR